MSKYKSILVPFSNKSLLVLVPFSNKKVLDVKSPKIPGFDIPNLTLIERELEKLSSYQNTDLFVLKSSILFSLIDKAVDEFTEINKKGFVNDTNLENYPIVRDYINMLLSDKAIKLINDEG